MPRRKTATRKVKKSSGEMFVAHVLDQLGELGRVRARAMFGGHGIYHRDLMVGLIADGVLYLKVDAQNQADFERAESRPFQYHRKDKAKPITMSYWEAPVETLHNPRALCEWTRRSYEAALRAKRGKTARK